MKRIIAFFAAMLIILSAVSAPALAEAEKNGRNGAVFSADTVYASENSDVEISVYLNGEYEANVVNLFLDYDGEFLEPVGGVTFGSLWNRITNAGGTVVTNTATEGQIGFVAVVPENSFSGSGALFIAKFHVNAAAGTEIPLTLRVTQFSYDDLDGTSHAIAYSVQNGAVYVTSPQTTRTVNFSVGSVTAQPAQNVEILVKIEGTYSANVLNLFVDYDKDLIELAGEPVNEAVWDAITSGGGTVVTNIQDQGHIGFVAVMPENSFNESGAIMSLNFHVPADAADGAVIPLELRVTQFSLDDFDGTVHPIAFSTQNGAVTVADSVYTVVFNANGGRGTMDSQVFAVNTAQALMPNAFTRTGHTFVGWNTAADGSGSMTYADEASVQGLSAAGGTVTLYAMWRANEAPYQDPAQNVIQIRDRIANDGKRDLRFKLSFVFNQAHWGALNLGTSTKPLNITEVGYSLNYIGGTNGTPYNVPEKPTTIVYDSNSEGFIISVVITGIPDVEPHSSVVFNVGTYLKYDDGNGSIIRVNGPTASGSLNSAGGSN